MNKEIAALEERLREAELAPDARFFEEVLADDGRWQIVAASVAKAE